MKHSTIALIVVTIAVLGSTAAAQNRRELVEVPNGEAAAPARRISCGPVSIAGGVWTPDFTEWTFWWEFNKEPILNLKRHLHDDGRKACRPRLGQSGSLRPTEAQIRTKIVPALRRALAPEPSTDIVTGCLIALAKIGDPLHEADASPLVPLLAAYLPYADDEVSEIAAVALGILGHPDAVTPLTSLLRDDAEGRRLVHRGEVPARTRAFAGYSLGLVGAATELEPVRQRVVRVLMTRLRGSTGESIDVDTACAIALGLVPLANTNERVGLTRVDQLDFLFGLLRGPIRPSFVKDLDGVDVLLSALERGRDPEQRGYIAIALGLLGSRAAVELLEEILPRCKYKPEQLQQTAIGSALLGNKTAVPRLIAMLSEAKSLATQAALSSALGFIGDRRAVDPLVDMLGNEEITECVRGFAAVSLGLVADKDTLPWNAKIAQDINYLDAPPALNDMEGTGILNIL